MNSHSLTVDTNFLKPRLDRNSEMHAETPTVISKVKKLSTVDIKDMKF